MSNPEQNTPKYTREQVFAKIEKLMAMADHPDTNPNLAASAAAKAQELMLLWAIDENELLAASGKVDEPKYVVERVPQLIAKVWHWEKWLSTHVATAFFCHRVYATSTRELCFCGRENDAKMAAFVFSQLRNTLDKMARAAFQRHAEEYKQKWGKSVYSKSNAQAYRGKWLTSWMDGAVAEVGAKLQAMNKQTTEGSSQALMVVETRKEQAAAFAHTQFTGLYTPKTRITVFTAAQEQGRKEGKEVQIHKGLTSTDRHDLPR